VSNTGHRLAFMSGAIVWRARRSPWCKAEPLRRRLAGRRARDDGRSDFGLREILPAAVTEDGDGVTLYLTRYCRTILNSLDLIQGWSDSPS
jgi:hypothetical protein